MSLAGRPGNFGTRFHNFLYRELKLNFVYKAFTTRDLRAAIADIRALGIRGCAVSMPFKEACIEFLDELDGSAGGIMSVNTIVNTDGILKAYNTDYRAVFDVIRSRGIPSDVEFALRGSGGMAKAVACALRDAGFTRGSVVARNRETGSALADQYGFRWTPELTDEAPELLINTTPVGMSGGEEADQLAFSEDRIRSARFIFDVVAIPAETPLVRLGSSSGKTVISGAEVIILQAVEQFVLYTGVRPDLGLIGKAAAFARTENGFSNPLPQEGITDRNVRAPVRAPLGAPFYSPYVETDVHRRNLPHWQQGQAWVFVTWRLGDSLPKGKLDQWKEEREIWLKHHPEPWDEKTEAEYHERFSRQIDEWLDQGSGSCVLKAPAMSNIVAAAMRHFDGNRYEIAAFVVMPNHVHALFHPLGDHALADIVKSWKGFTAREINKRMGNKGRLWQEEYWDRLIRNEGHFFKVAEYIRENPVKARLRSEEFFLFEKENGPENVSENGLSSPLI